MSLSIFETHSDTLVNQYWVPHLIWAKGKYWKYHHDISGIVRVNLELGGTTATTTKAAASSGACGGSNVDGDFKCMIEVANDTGHIEHEASTTKIGEDQIFYCNQRGISPEDAVSMIVNGFCREVLAELPMEFAVEARKLLEVSLEDSVG